MKKTNFRGGCFYCGMYPAPVCRGCNRYVCFRMACILKHLLLGTIIFLSACSGGDFNAFSNVQFDNRDSGVSSSDSGVESRPDASYLPRNADAQPESFDAHKPQAVVNDHDMASNDSGQSDTHDGGSHPHITDSATPDSQTQELTCPKATLAGYCTSPRVVHFPCNYTPPGCITSTLFPKATQIRCCL